MSGWRRSPSRFPSASDDTRLLTPGRFGDGRRVRIGILGGSFNPAHAGHRHVAEVARRALALDQVWLMVSPGNPLKPADGMAPFAERLASARRIAAPPRVIASDIEALLGTRHTWRTLALLHRRFPHVEFVFLIGADNLATLHRWDRWRVVAGAVKLAVVPRPGATRRALASPAAGVLRRARVEPRTLRLRHPPAWTLIPSRTSDLSATSIRQGNAAIARTPSAPAAIPARKTAKKAAKRAAATKTEVAAGPKKATRRKDAPAPAPARLDQLVALITGSLDDDKAEDIVVLDLEGRAAFADRMVIATGLADRQIQAMATHLADKLKEAGFGRASMEGLGSSEWVLLDAGDVVVHLFKPEARTEYRLEKMWGPESPEGESP